MHTLEKLLVSTKDVIKDKTGKSKVVTRAMKIMVGETGVADSPSGMVTSILADKEWHESTMLTPLTGVKVYTKFSTDKLQVERLHVFTESGAVRAVIYEINDKIWFRRRRDLNDPDLMTEYCRMTAKPLPLPTERAGRLNSGVRQFTGKLAGM